MVTIGVDAHKATHTLVAVDEAGRKVAEKTVAATTDGHLDALTWAAQWEERRFALEDCRHLTRRLEGDLLRAGEAVLRVSPRLMAGARRSSREPGKSDPIDALAVAAPPSASQICRSPSSTASSGDYDCSSITGTTSSPNGPVPSAGFAGTSTS
jgi:transposase